MTEPANTDPDHHDASRALLILAHGSPRPESNRGLYEIAELCRQRGIYHHVQVGFLECNEPSIPASIDLCVAEGVQEIVAVPFFLHTGTHVAEDLPALLNEGRIRHPSIDFRLGPFLGRAERLTDIIDDRITAAILLNDVT